MRFVPADTVFAAIFVPSCATAKPVEIINTPKRSAELALSRNLPRRSNGFHTAWPKTTVDEDVTIIPMNDVIANPTGIVISCDQIASLGFRENLVKSGLFIIKAAKFAMQFIMLLTHAQANLLPVIVEVWWTIGPSPFARAMDHAKNAIPHAGEKYALTVKTWRTSWIGYQIGGSIASQKNRKLTKFTVVTPELAGRPFGIVAQLGQIDRIISLMHSPGRLARVVLEA